MTGSKVAEPVIDEAPATADSLQPMAIANNTAELARRAQAGDEDAFTRLVERFQGPLHQYAFRIVGNYEQARELVQDALLKAWVALPRTAPGLAWNPWIYRITQNVCLDTRRHDELIRWCGWEDSLADSRSVLYDDHTPETSTISREVQLEVRQILDSLPTRYRTPLVLREYRGLSYDAIAEVLETTRAAVKSVLFRARSVFRAHPLAAGLRDGLVFASGRIAAGVYVRRRPGGAVWYYGASAGHLGGPKYLGRYKTAHEAAQATAAWSLHNQAMQMLDGQESPT